MPPGPPGSIAWTYVASNENNLPYSMWAPMGFTGTEYVALTYCEQPPSGVSELWSSSDGLVWSSEEIPCDTSLVPVGESVFRTKGHDEPDVFFKEGDADWTEVRLLVSDPDGGFLHPSDSIWELDDYSLLFDPDFVLWEGFQGYVAWVFEFDDQLISYCSAPNQDFSRLREGFRAYRTQDNSTWDEIAAPPFYEQGFIHGSVNGSLTRSIFAHQDSTAIAVLSNGQETRMWRTVDGTQWDDVTPAQLGVGGIWAGGDFWVQGLELWDPSARSLDFLISTDGLDWKQANVPDAYREFRGTVRVAGNKIFVSGPEGLLVGAYTPETTDSR